MIQIEHISKSFGSKQVLEDINLVLESGRVYGVVGMNGAGKTTLFNCIAGLEDYVGSIKSDFTDLKNQTSILHTTPYFFDRLTAREYLRLLRYARKLDVVDWDTKNIFDLPLDEYANLYSTGMKKKLALTGILLQQSDFFILDEPFNGVDIQSNIIIIEIIKRLRAMNKTILISSHIFSTLSEVCDSIFLLEDRQIQQTVDQVDFPALETQIKAATLDASIDALFE